MQNLNFTNLTPDEANIILAGLGELPAKISMGLLLKLKQQGDAQMQPRRNKKCSTRSDPWPSMKSTSTTS